MKPVHELTSDEAVLELEQVCDQLCEFSDAPAAPRAFLERRRTELEAWILMHQPKQASEPKTRTSAAPAEVVLLPEHEDLPGRSDSRWRPWLGV